VSPVVVPDPSGMDRGRTLNGAMDGLMTLAEGPVATAFREAMARRRAPKVTRYRPLKPNAPAIWHERRPGRVDPVDTAHDRSELYVAVILALEHADGTTDGEQLEIAADAAQAIYRRELRKRGAVNWVHQARLVNIEPPTPTVIDQVALMTTGLVIRVRIDAPNQ
jgi:hypothetical protein